MTDVAAKDSLTVRDNRTGQEYDIAITDNTIAAKDLGQIRLTDEEPGLATYDPGFVNTASCRSSVTYIDGDKGILEYRGYPIEQLAEKSNFLEVAYLLVHGSLPSKEAYDAWVDRSVSSVQSWVRPSSTVRDPIRYGLPRPPSAIRPSAVRWA